MRLPGVELFDRGARGVEFRLDGRKCAEGSGLEGGWASHAAAERVFAFRAEASDKDSRWGEELVGGVPDEANDVVEEGDAAVDVVVLLPEARGLPTDLVEGGQGDGGEGLLGLWREVVLGGCEDGDGHGAD